VIGYCGTGLTDAKATESIFSHTSLSTMHSPSAPALSIADTTSALSARLSPDSHTFPFVPLVSYRCRGILYTKRGRYRAIHENELELERPATVRVRTDELERNPGLPAAPIGVVVVQSPCLLHVPCSGPFLTQRRVRGQRSW
jgi:hypothetical protein